MKLKPKLILSILTILLVISIVFIQNKDTTAKSPEIETPDLVVKNDIDKSEPDANKDTDISQSDNEIDYLKDTTYEDDEGLIIVENTDDVLVLANKKRNLPSDYIPEDLVIPNVRFPFKEDIPKKYLKKEAAEALENLFQKAEKDDIILYAISGYRSYNRQKTLFDNKSNKVGPEKANLVVAFPGQSEHQTGLAMDVSSQSANFTLEEDFEDTAEGKWLKDNAHKAGFIIRYKKDSEDITGYNYEPWHIRYVGKDIAKEIYNQDLTLEEFLGDVN